MVDIASIIRRVIALILGLGLVAVAVAFAGNPVMDVAKQHQQSWTAEPVEATVISSYTDTDIKEYTRDPSPSTVNRQYSGETFTEAEYYVIVNFKYTVNGETYRSRNFAPPGNAEAGSYGVGSNSEAKKIANRYPKNETVTAYYLPNNPETAFLTKKATSPHLLLIILIPASLPLVFGVLFIGGGLGLVDPQGTWKSRLGGYLFTLFMLGPITGIGAVITIATPSSLSILGPGVGVVMFLGVFYYTGQMMFLGKSGSEVGLWGSGSDSEDEKQNDSDSEKEQQGS